MTNHNHFPENPTQPETGDNTISNEQHMPAEDVTDATYLRYIIGTKSDVISGPEYIPEYLQ